MRSLMTMYTMYTKYSYTNTITLRSFIYLLGNRLRQKKSLIFCSRYFSLLYDLGIASICIFVRNMQENAFMYYHFTIFKNLISICIILLFIGELKHFVFPILYINLHISTIWFTLKYEKLFSLLYVISFTIWCDYF